MKNTALTLKRVLLCAGLMAAGVATQAAWAAPLTTAQCNDYPFVKMKGPVTHKEIVNELSELESVGYQPSAGDDNDYPDDLETAQQKLSAKYQRDCVKHAGTAS